MKQVFSFFLSVIFSAIFVLSPFSAYALSPKTELTSNLVEEALSRIRKFTHPLSETDSKLLTEVTANLFVTKKGAKGWQHPSLDASGLYAKFLPPFELADRRFIVPIIGDLYDVASIETKIADEELENKLKKLEAALTLVQKEESERRIRIVNRQITPQLKELFQLLASLSEKVPRLFQANGALNQTAFYGLLSKLEENKDPVLESFLTREKKDFDEIRNAEFGDLLKNMPDALWYRGFALLWNEYFYEAVEDKKEIFIKEREKLESRELVQAWKLINEVQPDYLAHQLKEKRKVIVTIKKLSDLEIQQQFGLIRLKKRNGQSEQIHLQTFKNVVGRLGFFPKLGGMVEASSLNGRHEILDSPAALIQALIRGDTLGYQTARVELKAMGVLSPKIHQFEFDGSFVILRGENVEQLFENKSSALKNFLGKMPFHPEVSLHVSGLDSETTKISVQEFCQLPGIFFHSKYQPGFPSPSGTEVAYQSKEAILAEQRYRKLEGEPPYHTFSRFHFTEELAGSLRLTSQKNDLNLRLIEAFEEYRLNPEGSVLGRWKKEGLLPQKLREFFKNLGRNQRALMAIGKVWVHLGGRMIHSIDNGEAITLDPSYRFFLNNVDLKGAQADLGDFMELDAGLNEQDVSESIAMVLLMANQFLLDLEQRELVKASNEYFRFFAQGFFGSSEKNILLPELVSKDAVKYKQKHHFHAAFNQTYTTNEREPLSSEFESFIQHLYSRLDPLIKKYWPVAKTGYIQADDRSIFERLNPYKQKINYVNEEKYEQQVLSSFNKKIESVSAAISIAPVLNAVLNELKTAETPDLEEILKKKAALFPFQSRKRNFFDLLLALHRAFASQQDRVSYHGKELLMPEALDLLNQLRLELSLHRAETPESKTYKAEILVEQSL